MPKARKIVLFVVLLLVILYIAVIGVIIWQRNSDDSAKDTSQPTDSWDQRIANAFKSGDCPVVPKPELDDSYYKGRLIDAHFHPPSLPSNDVGTKIEIPEKDKTQLGVNITFDEIVCTFKNDGTSGRAFAFFPVYPDIYQPALEVVKKAMEKYPEVFVPFINPPDNDGSPTGYPTVDATTLKKMLAVYPGLFKGYGELGLYERPGGAPALAPDSSRLQEIYPVVREHKLIVMLHLGQGQAESYEKTLRANPDVQFIFHGDQLITQNQDGTQDLRVLDGILSRNPNVAYGVDELFGDVFIMRPEVGKAKFLDHFKDYKPLLEKDVATWKAFIENHPDQVFWDSDRGDLTWSLDIEVGRALTDYARAFIAHLDPKVQERYAYKNAEKLFSGY